MIRSIIYFDNYFLSLGGECNLNEINVVGGSYTVDPEQDTSGNMVARDSVIEYVCDDGFFLAQGYRAACKEGSWDGETQAVCQSKYLIAVQYSVLSSTPMGFNLERET